MKTLPAVGKRSFKVSSLRSFMRQGTAPFKVRREAFLQDLLLVNDDAHTLFPASPCVAQCMYLEKPMSHTSSPG